MLCAFPVNDTFVGQCVAVCNEAIILVALHDAQFDKVKHVAKYTDGDRVGRM